MWIACGFWSNLFPLRLTVVFGLSLDGTCLLLMESDAGLHTHTHTLTRSHTYMHTHKQPCGLSHGL